MILWPDGSARRVNNNVATRWGSLAKTMTIELYLPAPRSPALCIITHKYLYVRHEYFTGREFIKKKKKSPWSLDTLCIIIIVVCWRATMGAPELRWEMTIADDRIGFIMLSAKIDRRPTGRIKTRVTIQLKNQTRKFHWRWSCIVHENLLA